MVVEALAVHTVTGTNVLYRYVCPGSPLSPVSFYRYVHVPAPHGVFLPVSIVRTELAYGERLAQDEASRCKIASTGASV